MFESIYLGLTGLAAFSRNLTVIGNNVSNMNTPGFRASEMAFSDLFYENALSDRNDGSGARLQLGSGVGVDGTRLLFTQGSLRDTGNPTDLGIDGSGFFVLRTADRTAYTRAGDFSFDSDGFLVARDGARVAALGAGGSLADLGIGSLRTNPPRATSTVHFVDNLSSGDSDHSVDVTAFDAAGGSHPLTVKFTNNGTVTPRSWRVEVSDAAGGAVASGEIRFNGDGSPASGFNSLAFTLNAAGAPATAIALDFGEAGTFSGATNFSAGSDSTLKTSSQDGFAPGAMTSVTFDPDGTVAVSYSNGQSARGARVALATFASPEALAALGGARFGNGNGQAAVLGGPGDPGFGAIRAGALESANVDLAQQFGELIITQRGYQAASQVVSTANDMIQQLLDMRSHK